MNFELILYLCTMKTSSALTGYLCGIAAAVSYGTNPLFALFLYRDGLQPTSVLFYRFAFGAAILGAMLLAGRKAMGVTRREGLTLLVLGLLFAASSLTYYFSFKFMAAGLASTILFFYPVMVAVIMAVWFGERVGIGTVLAIVLSLAGIALLYQGDGTATLSPVGMVLVIISALTYALYIVVLNRSHIRMSSLKLTFYVLLVCVACNVALSLMVPSFALQALPTTRSWLYAAGLGLVPTVLSLVTMAVAVAHVGGTPTAIMGALEPLTAVAIGALVFGEALTPRLMLGIVLILMAVTTVVLAKQVSPHRVFTFVGHMGQRVVKKWRWK